MPPSKLLLLLLATLTTAQTFTESIAPSLTAANGTQIPNPTLLTTTLAINVEDYWNLRIGPVQEAATTTTVSPTPVSSTELIPPPPLYYAPFPTGQQVFQTPKNESWSFPKDFWWGVAGAAQQIEGGVKAEGRGELMKLSVWMERGKSKILLPSTLLRPAQPFIADPLTIFDQQAPQSGTNFPTSPTTSSTTTPLTSQTITTTSTSKTSRGLLLWV